MELCTEYFKILNQQLYALLDGNEIYNQNLDHFDYRILLQYHGPNYVEIAGLIASAIEVARDM